MDVVVAVFSIRAPRSVRGGVSRRDGHGPAAAGAQPKITERMESEAMSNPSIGKRTASSRALAPVA